MQYEIDSDILNDTVKCQEDFSCLYGKKDCICEVEDSFSHGVLFIKPSNINNTCNYRQPFGYSYLCACPTRKELYKLYGI